MSYDSFFDDPEWLSPAEKAARAADWNRQSDFIRRPVAPPPMPPIPQNLIGWFGEMLVEVNRELAEMHRGPIGVDELWRFCVLGRRGASGSAVEAVGRLLARLGAGRIAADARLRALSATRAGTIPTPFDPGSP